MKRRWTAASVALAACLIGTVAGGAEEPLQEAHVLWQQGSYDEALERLEEQQEADPVALALAQSRCYQSLGRWSEAQTVVETALEAQGDNADLLARRAELHLYRGRWEQADAVAGRALEQSDEHLLARWVRAQVALETGRLEDADKQCEWFVHHYAAANLARPEDLLLVGRAAEQYIRWNMRGEEQSEQLNLVLNDLYYGASRKDEHFWQGWYAAGLLWLETYDRPAAERDLKRALAINPRAAEVHVALGQAALVDYELDTAERHCSQALAINPNLPAARQLQADLYVTAEDLDAAVKELTAAQEVHPSDAQTLGRLAACYLLQEGPPGVAAAAAQIDALTTPEDDLREAPSGTSRFSALLRRVVASNPRPAVFLHTLGERLEAGNQFDAARTCFERALEVMPTLAPARTDLGKLLMRVGLEDEARKQLAEAFEHDPFNVRTHNMLKVLQVLEQYETLDTPHFRVRFDPNQDRVLARYLAEYLEDEHAGLVEQLGYEPKEPALFEIFNDARPYEGHRSQSGHQWFSARTIGLPEVHTIGACVGKVVAMTSPEEIQKPFNWARVAKHEYIHVITLEQTNYNIPHWFTEALAVLYEGSARPEEWDKLLARRVADGSLLDLDTINRAFIHPKRPDDRTLAYCQALLYAEHMIATYGPQTVPAMLDAYARGLSTRQAIEKAVGTPQETFEQGYREYLSELVATLPAASGQEESLGLAALQKAQRSDPQNADLTARLALAMFQRKQYPEARRLAVAARKQQENHPLASYVLARLSSLIGDTESARATLEPALDGQTPDARVLSMLANLEVREENWPRAAELYALGRRHDPRSTQWVAGLILVYGKQGDREKLEEALVQLSQMQNQDPVIRKKLARMALEDHDYERALEYARQALHVDVADVETHRLLAAAFEGLEQWAAAEREYQVALELKGDDAEVREGLERVRAKRADGE